VKCGIFHDNDIEAFHNKVACHLTNRHIRKIKDTEIWYYPNMKEVFKDIGLIPIQQYINKRKKKLMVWAQNRTIYHETLTVSELMGNARSFWGVSTPPNSDKD
jgi:hypothetical protein